MEFKYKFILFLLFFIPQFLLAETEITLLHTNDLHSKYRAEISPKDKIFLGNIARLKTKIDLLRSSKSNVLLLDAGDFTEGSLYYSLNDGLIASEVMNSLGYDAIVIGNHDWLKGPSFIESLLEVEDFNIPLVSNNIKVSPKNFFNYPNFFTKFQKKWFFNLQNVRIGVIGLSTDESFFKSYISPLKILSPEAGLQKTINRMKTQADIIILLSHLGYDVDLKVGENIQGIDLIISGHKHVTFFKPIFSVNKKTGKKIPIFCAGEYGHFLGEINLLVPAANPENFTFRSGLHRIDSSIPEDSLIKKQLAGYDEELKKIYGDDLFSPLAESKVNLFYEDNKESLIGNIVVDAFRDELKTDFSLDGNLLLSSYLEKGKINRFQLFDLYPEIINFKTHNNWNLYVLRGLGKILKIIMKKLFQMGYLVNISGGEIVYDKKTGKVEIFKSNKAIGDLNIYSLAVSEGIAQAIRFPAYITKKKYATTVWDSLSRYMKKISPITKESATLNRVRILNQDYINIPSNQELPDESEPYLNSSILPKF